MTPRKALLLAAIALAAALANLVFVVVVLAASHPTSVVAPVTTPKDSRVFTPYLKQAIANFTANTGDAVNFNLKDYYAAGDVNVTSTAIAGCADVAPTFTAGGTIAPGTTLTQADKNNATWGGTLSGGAANNTYTIKVTNCVDVVTGFTDSIDWAITAAAGSSTTIPQSGVNYFVCPGGSDSAAGNTLATRWGSIGKVNGAFSAATSTRPKVWLCAGSTFTTPLTVDWSGNTSDHVKIGTYYTSTGNPATGTAYELVPDNPTAFPTAYTWSNGGRAILRGTYNSTCSVKLNPALPAATKCAHDGFAGTSQPAPGTPSSNYAGMVQFDCSFCDLLRIRVLDSAGASFRTGGTPPGSGAFLRSDHNIIDNELGNAAWGSLQLQGTHNDFVYGNIIYRGGLGSNRLGDKALGLNGDGGVLLGAFQSDVQGGVNSNYNNINTLLEKNYIYGGTQENIILSQVGHVIMRGNRIGAGNAESFYNQTCGNCVYEYNIISGGTPRDHDEPARYGIGMVAESAFGIHPETDVIIRGNMISNTNRCIHILPQGLSVSGGIKINAKIYNNTCVDTGSGITIGGDGTPMTAANIGSKGIQIKNNIFYNEVGFTGTMCGTPSQGSEIGIVWDYNFWGSTPLNAKCIGAHDVIGNPLLVGSGFVAKSAWTTFPTAADFGLQAGSPALAIGTPLTATVLTVDATEFPIRSNITYPCATFDTAGFVIDSVCRAVDASPDNGSQGR